MLKVRHNGNDFCTEADAFTSPIVLFAKVNLGILVTGKAGLAKGEADL